MVKKYTRQADLGDMAEIADGLSVKAGCNLKFISLPGNVFNNSRHPLAFQVLNMLGILRPWKYCKGAGVSVLFSFMIIPSM